ncbi:hypothetical protein WA158_005062 [Blastocystis sp. Blastoise]
MEIDIFLAESGELSKKLKQIGDLWIEDAPKLSENITNNIIKHLKVLTKEIKDASTELCSKKADFLINMCRIDRPKCIQEEEQWISIMNTFQETFLPLLFKDIIISKDYDIECRRQISYLIIMLLNDNSRNVIKICSTYTSCIKKLAQNALEIQDFSTQCTCIEILYRIICICNSINHIPIKRIIENNCVLQLNELKPDLFRDQVRILINDYNKKKHAKTTFTCELLSAYIVELQGETILGKTQWLDIGPYGLSSYVDMCIQNNEKLEKQEEEEEEEEDLQLLSLSWSMIHQIEYIDRVNSIRILFSVPASIDNDIFNVFSVYKQGLFAVRLEVSPSIYASLSLYLTTAIQGRDITLINKKPTVSSLPLLNTEPKHTPSTTQYINTSSYSKSSIAVLTPSQKIPMKSTNTFEDLSLGNQKEGKTNVPKDSQDTETISKSSIVTMSTPIQNHSDDKDILYKNIPIGNEQNHELSSETVQNPILTPISPNTSSSFISKNINTNNSFINNTNCDSITLTDNTDLTNSNEINNKKKYLKSINSPTKKSSKVSKDISIQESSRNIMENTKNVSNSIIESHSSNTLMTPLLATEDAAIPAVLQATQPLQNSSKNNLFSQLSNRPQKSRSYSSVPRDTTKSANEMKSKQISSKKTELIENGVHDLSIPSDHPINSSESISTDKKVSNRKRGCTKEKNSISTSMKLISKQSTNNLFIDQKQIVSIKDRKVASKKNIVNKNMEKKPLVLEKVETTRQMNKKLQKKIIANEYENDVNNEDNSVTIKNPKNTIKDDTNNVNDIQNDMYNNNDKGKDEEKEAKRIKDIPTKFMDENDNEKTKKSKTSKNIEQVIPNNKRIQADVGNRRRMRFDGDLNEISHDSSLSSSFIGIHTKEIMNNQINTNENTKDIDVIDKKKRISSKKIKKNSIDFNFVSDDNNNNENDDDDESDDDNMNKNDDNMNKNDNNNNKNNNNDNNDINIDDDNMNRNDDSIEEDISEEEDEEIIEKKNKKMKPRVTITNKRNKSIRNIKPSIYIDSEEVIESSQESDLYSKTKQSKVTKVISNKNNNNDYHVNNNKLKKMDDIKKVLFEEEEKEELSDSSDISEDNSLKKKNKQNNNNKFRTNKQIVDKEVENEDILHEEEEEEEDDEVQTLRHLLTSLIQKQKEKKQRFLDDCQKQADQYYQRLSNDIINTSREELEDNIQNEINSYESIEKQLQTEMSAIDEIYARYTDEMNDKADLLKSLLGQYNKLQEDNGIEQKLDEIITRTNELLENAKSKANAYYYKKIKGQKTKANKVSQIEKMVQMTFQTMANI